jgi:hypothetical protein
MHDPAVVDLGVQLLRVLSVSGLLIAVALTYTGGLQGTGDTRSPLYISIVSQVIVPLGICFVIKETGKLDPNRHLARDPRGARDTLCVECDSLQAREVEKYCCRVRGFTQSRKGHAKPQRRTSTPLRLCVTFASLRETTFSRPNFS